ncbi:MAG TPA: PIG-L family deacetylase [Saprospiraceae bacterium]|nr:PIG-L family deacetylase [Saprospiraceae bacterium]HMP25109.1 PIG-L family deacetylase [Saprospiraceae bacterium]
MCKKCAFLWLILWLMATTVLAQTPKRWTSGDIYEALQKLNFLGSALYVAAHPDDENTRLIAYLANEKKANIAYLSLTRGDGGQNLIGPEIAELLGIIRTQELLAARRIDGGKQLFSRANDFGFSKHPDETLNIWNKDAVLSDVVWAIRRWQPDVIINRFSHESAGSTHGHHTASAMLAYEAFDLAGKRNVYPEQLKHTEPWQPRRLFFNTSWWFYGSRENFDRADKSDLMSVDIGVYYPLKGKSNPEIAAESRSMHKCQGFGSAGTRGSELEFLQVLKGDLPKGKADIFEGINTTWTRVPGGAPIGKLLAEAEKDFNHANPAASIPQLIAAYKSIKALPDGYWKRVKQAEIEDVIQACLGLFAEAIANDFSATPGQQVELNVEITNRSQVALTLQSLTFLPEGKMREVNEVIANNEPFRSQHRLVIPADIAYTNAYWLNENWELGMYTVADPLLRGLPETPRSFKVRFQLVVAGEPMDIEREVVFKKTDSVKGEVYQPFEITPPMFANVREKVYVFSDEAPQTVEVILKSGAANLSGSVALQHPAGWRVEPQQIDFKLPLKGEELTVRFQLFPSATQSEGLIRPIVTTGGKQYSQEIVVIAYDHIPTQTVLRQSQAKVAKIDLKKAGDRIGYFMGAGDDIPASLRQIGYQVTLLEDGDLNPENLARYDAVIMGVRAYNTKERLKFAQPKLLEYVQNGGTLIVQYNTSNGLVIPAAQIGPYSLKLSRDRVAVEEAEIRFLKPKHPVLNFPNKITQKDFAGWVQERGLYFPDEWDPRFEAILSCNDPGEPARDGGLLIAPYGKGHYIYTGYSFFRELPAGVPGAFRLFANMISIGKEAKP